MPTKIGPVPAHDPDASQDLLPADEQAIDVALRGRIISIWEAIPHLSEYVKIEQYDRFPDTDAEDIEISTVPDLVVPSQARTSLIEIGIPTVEEFERTSDLHTQLTFVYPFSVSIEAVDKWPDTMPYKNSAQLFMAIYMVCRKGLKFNRTLGYKNCVHDYLQQVNALTVEPEDTEGRLHSGDWSLTVKCTGIYV